MLCTQFAWVCLGCLLLCKEKGSSPMSAITERRSMGLYKVPLSMYMLGFRMLLLVVTQSMFISIWISRLEKADSRTASVGLLNKSDGVIVVEWAEKKKRCLTSCGAVPQSAQTLRLASFLILVSYETRSLQYPDLS